MSLRSFIRNIPPLRHAAKAVFPLVQRLNHKRTVVKTINGITYSLDLNELIDSTIYYFGSFESETTEALRSLVSQGQTVLDIGANIGCHALLLSKLVGSQGRVFAFEPMEAAATKLHRNLLLNPWASNVTVEKILLSNVCSSPATVAFKNSWPLFGPPTRIIPEMVPALTVDEYALGIGSPKIDFIKLDVDGYEYKVISGAQRVLSKDHPRLLVELANYTLESVGDSLPALIDLLFAFGYTVRADNSSVPFKSKQEILSTIPQDSAINVICS